MTTSPVTTAAGSATPQLRPPVIRATCASVSGITGSPPVGPGRSLARQRRAQRGRGDLRGRRTAAPSRATYWPVSWPLPATTMTSPGDGQRRPPARSRRPGRAPRSTRARSPCGTLSTPSSIAARIASGSSDRGLSLVRIATSASDAAAAPIIGRLARSRSPPQPSTMIRFPWVTGRSERSTASTAPGLCE